VSLQTSIACDIRNEKSAHWRLARNKKRMGRKSARLRGETLSVEKDGLSRGGKRRISQALDGYRSCKSRFRLHSKEEKLSRFFKAGRGCKRTNDKQIKRHGQRRLDIEEKKKGPCGWGKEERCRLSGKGEVSSKAEFVHRKECRGVTGGQKRKKKRKKMRIQRGGGGRGDLAGRGRPIRGEKDVKTAGKGEIAADNTILL